MAAPPAPRPSPAARLPAPHRFASALSERPVWFALGGAVAVAVVGLGLYTPRYETNDDATMNLIAAGVAFGDRPDEHLLYTNVLVGLPLRRLYEATRTVPWYGLCQFAVLFAAAAGSAYALLRVDPSPRQAAVAALYLGVAVLPCLARVQFTTTAFLASLAGMLLFLAPLRGAAPWSWKADAAAGALLVVGSLVRFESFLLAGLVAAPVAAVAARAAPARAARRAVPVAAAVAVAAALYFFNRGYYARDPAWAGFYEYNAQRAEFTDYARFQYSPQTKPVFDAVGWSEVDLKMLMRWFFADRDKYSLARMRQIAATAPPSPRPSPWKTLAEMPRALYEARDLLRLVLAGLCVALLSGGGWRGFLLPGVLFGVAFVLVVVLATYFWVPKRVAFPLFAGALAGAALRPGVGGSTRWATRLGGPACAAALVLWSVLGLAKSDRMWRGRHDEALRAMHQLRPSSDQLFVVWRDCLPYEDLVTPLEIPGPMRELRCLGLSALWPTPFTERRLRKFEIGDIYRAIWKRPDVFLVAHPDFVLVFFEYVREHYPTEPQPDLRWRFPSPDPRRPFPLKEAPPFCVFRAGQPDARPPAARQ